MRDIRPLASKEMGLRAHRSPRTVTILCRSMKTSLPRAPLIVAAVALASALFAPLVPSATSVATAAAAPAPARHRSALLGGGDGSWIADKDLGSLYTVTKGAGVQHGWTFDDPVRRKV